MRFFSVLLLLACAAVAPLGRAQLLDTITQPDSQPQNPPLTGSFFGDRVAMSGDYAVIGEPGFSAPGLVDCGRIHVLRRDILGQWSNVWTLTGVTPQGFLGSAVDLQVVSADDVVVVAGEPGRARAVVAVHQPSTNNWSVSTAFVALGGNFGAAVATNGLDIFIGEPDTVSGRVHVYRRAPGTSSVEYDATVVLGGVGTPVRFGYAVAESGGRFVVSAPDLHGITNEGYSFVYKRQGASWVQEAELRGWWVEGFGESLAFDGDRILVGSPRADVGSYVDAGRVTSFVRSGGTWTQEHLFQPVGPSTGALFGSSVALDGTTVAIGAPAAMSGQGRVSIHSGASGWPVAAQITSPTPSADDTFGNAVALAGGFLLAGDAADSTHRGAVYSYQPLGDDCNANGLNDLYDIISGGSADVNANAAPDECETSTCLLEKLVASSFDASDHAGYSVAAGSHCVIVGVYGDDVGTAVDAGSALVYARNGVDLVFEERLVVPGARAGDNFGNAVVLMGDVAFVGAPGDDDLGLNSGSVHAFQRTAPAVWTYLGELRAYNGNPLDGFGGTLAADGNVLFVGAASKDFSGVDGRGRVYAYDVVGGSATLLSQFLPGSTHDFEFGSAIDANEGVVAIGVPGATDAGLDTGAVYVYRRVGSTWTLEVRDTGFAGSKFGSSVAVDGGRLAVGAPAHASYGLLAGSVTTYEYDAGAQIWSGRSTWGAPGTNEWDSLGTSVAFVGDVLLAGSPFRDTPAAAGGGAVHGFRKLGASWVQTALLTTADAPFNQAFGQSLAWFDSMLVVGAYGDDVGSTDTGSAYVFGLDGIDCNGNITCDLCEIQAAASLDSNVNGFIDSCELVPYCFGDGSGAACPCGNNAPAGSMWGCLNSMGTGGVLTSNGVASISVDTFELVAGQMPNSSCLFFQGTTQVNGGQGSAWGDGLRCAGGSILRLGSKSIVNGVAAYPGVGDASISTKGAVTVPGWRYYSVWYRNSATFCTPAVFNYTSALAVRWSS